MFPHLQDIITNKRSLKHGKLLRLDSMLAQYKIAIDSGFIQLQATEEQIEAYDLVRENE
jgi:hypothetical protein